MACVGLTKDDQALQAERLKMWSDFNTCWLAVLQKQKDNTQAMIDSGQPLPLPQNLLQENFLERMARELIHWCDGLERHGLVDYQMGVWEEEIMDCESFASFLLYKINENSASRMP